jgi:lysozyme
MHTTFLEQIRSFEGYQPKAQWDYAQFTNGFGTKARHAGEVIDKAEAERRFKSEISEAEALVDKFAPGLDGGTRAALTSLTFNAGTKWMQSGLGEAVRSGDFETARTRFLEYTKAGGEALPGLVSRRLQEATWFDAGEAAAANAAQSSAASAKAQVSQAVEQALFAARTASAAASGPSTDVLPPSSDGSYSGAAPDHTLAALRDLLDAGHKMRATYVETDFLPGLAASIQNKDVTDLLRAGRDERSDNAQQRAERA